MNAQRHYGGASEGLIIALAIISVLLIIVPAGIYAGIVLAFLVLGAVLANNSHRREPRMVMVSTLAVLATTGALIASLTVGG